MIFWKDSAKEVDEKNLFLKKTSAGVRILARSAEY